MNKRFIDYVNVFIGTAGSGHAILGPQRPHGTVKLNPDTDRLPNAGYDYTDKKILGFSHTHTEGAGASGGRGNILLTAASGKVKTDESEYASNYSHKNEIGKVGYYKVHLDDPDVDAELTCTNHVGFHRYTFKDLEKSPYIIVDIGHTLGKKHNCNGLSVKVIDKFNINGTGEYPIVPGKAKSPYKLYFHITFDKPILRYGLWDNFKYKKHIKSINGRIGGGCFWFGRNQSRVCAKVGISYISVNKAKENLHIEAPGWDFDSVVRQTEKSWEELLKRVQVKGLNPDQKIIFYSGLYRALNQPTNYEENGEYLNMFGKQNIIEQSNKGFYLDDWALWDTFRTTHPLQTIVDWQTRDDIINTFIKIYEKGGWLPICTAPNEGYHPEMIGHNSIPVILDAAVKGYNNFDLIKAYQAAKKTSTEYSKKMHRLGTPKEYMDLGYIPGGENCKDDNFSVSITMEFAYADWCTAMLAKMTGNQKDYEYFLKRSMNYKNLFDKKTGFARRKDERGNWIEPFDPSDSFKNGFCECTSWEYTFFVPHDIQGLINLTGGKEAFVNKLDSFFEGEFFNYENETSIQVSYLYVYAEAAWKTQKIVRTYIDKIYKNRPSGLWGEDDAGAMSAWMVFSSMGFYPVCPGQSIYVLGSPVFNEIKLKTQSGNQFIIKAENNSKENVYVNKVWFNGQKYNKSYITHEMLQKGGVLKFEMSNQPNYKLFTEVPPSLSKYKDDKPLDINKINCNAPNLKFYHHTKKTIDKKGLCGIDKKYNTRKTTDALFYQDKNKIYVYSKGNQNRSEYGIIYKKEPVKGDFVCQVTILHYDISSPYAPAGIIVSDNMQDIDIYGHHKNDIVTGAMAKRGYYLYGKSENCIYPTGYKYAVDCPKQGCKIKLIKKGDIYSSYYIEKNMTDWKLINKIKVLDCSDFRYVGLYQSSCSPDRRSVVFKDFIVKSI